MIHRFTASFIAAVIAALAIAAAAPARAGIIYDLKNDWNPPANPNGVWSYNSGTLALPYQLVGLPGGATGAYIYDTNPADHKYLPLWFQATGPFSGVQSGDIVVHTQDDGNGVGLGPANLTWTSPLVGLATISGNVWQLKDFPGRSNQWSIYDNGHLLTSGRITGADAYDRSHAFDFASGSGGASVLQNISVLSGDVLSLFIVSTTPNNTRDGYFVDTNFTVDVTPATSTPEPASLAMLAGAASVAGFGAALRRRRGTKREDGGSKMEDRPGEPRT